CPYRRYMLGTAHRAAGHVDDYRSTCAKMLARFRETKSPQEAASFAYCSIVRDDAVADKQELVRLAKLGSNVRPGSERIHAAALYRAGDHQGALEQFDVAAKHRPPRARDWVRAWDWLFRAMAHHKLGQADQARDCLAKAVKWIEEAEANKTHAASKPDWVGWNERIEVQHLRAEAEKLMSVK